MAENEFKEGMKYTPKNTEPSKDKEKHHCRHLTDKEIKRIKEYCKMDNSLEIYSMEKLKTILRSIIVMEIINAEGYDASDLKSVETKKNVEDRIKSWFNLNEQFFNIKARFFQLTGKDDRGTINLDSILPLLIVPGYEEQQVVKEDSQK